MYRNGLPTNFGTVRCLQESRQKALGAVYAALGTTTDGVDASFHRGCVLGNEEFVPTTHVPAKLVQLFESLL